MKKEKLIAEKKYVSGNGEILEFVKYKNFNGSEIALFKGKSQTYYAHDEDGFIGIYSYLANKFKLSE